MLDLVLDTLLDLLKLLPFLFLTYLLLEFLEHWAEERSLQLIRRKDAWAPFAGAALGLVPQCGFSASAAGLYAQRLISVGTLVAVFLSTSDEMLPVMISEGAPAMLMLRLLAAKFVCGAFVGLLLDRLLPRFASTEDHVDIHATLCEPEACGCEEGSVLRSALRHTISTAAFILVISFLLNLLIHFIGTERLAGLILNRAVLGPLIAAAVGLIPNCAASVLLTELYLSGAMSAGALLAGLLSAAGLGILVLFRVNRRKWRENLRILLLLYLAGVCFGILCDLLHIVF